MDVSQATGAFALTTSPAAYLPRPDTERALFELEEWVLSGATSSIWITGPPGMGKTLLLKVLADRLSGRRLCVYVAYPMLPPEELAAWVLDALGKSAGDAPQNQIAWVAEQRAEQGGLVLLIDDAMLMPPATRSALDDWYGESNGALRSVLAATGSLSAIGASGSSGNASLTLDRPLSFEESRALLVAAMERSQLGAEARALFDTAKMEELHECACGVPTRLLIEAGRVLFVRREELAPGTTAPLPAARAAPVERAAELRSLATLVGLGLESGPVPGGTRDRQLPPPVRSQRRRILTAAAWGAGAFGGSALATLIAIQLMGGDPEPTAAPLAVARAPAREKSVVDIGAGSIESEREVASGAPETPETTATRIVALEFDDLPVAQTAAPAPVPAPAKVPDIASAQPTAPVVPARAAATDDSQIVTEGVIRKGGCLAASFRRHDIPIPILTRVVREVGDVFDFTRSRPGDRYTVIRDSAGVLVAFRYVIGPGDELRVRRTGEDYTVIR